MSSFLDWYFTGKTGYIIAFGAVIGFALFVFVKSKRKKNKGAKKKWTFYLLIVAIIANVLSVTYFNPSYWGYGSPDYFTLIQVTDDYVVLYDEMTSYIFDDNSSATQNELNQPNVRIHVVNLKDQVVELKQLLGGYLFPKVYGETIILVEKNSYSTYSDGNEINSVQHFNLETMQVEELARNEMVLSIDDRDVQVFDIFSKYGWYFIKTVKGDTYKLVEETLTFVPYDPDWDPIPYRPLHSMKSAQGSPDKMELVVNSKSTDISFLNGQVVSELKQDTLVQVLVYSQTDLNNNNPILTMIDQYSKVKWEKDLDYFNGIENHKQFTDFQRTYLTERNCFVTIDEYLYCFDNQTGSLNWEVKF
ncbi:MAG: hypothetical protein ACI9J3_003828 [Parvicellaceae bacterium]|jgi:hypothetical protein